MPRPNANETRRRVVEILGDSVDQALGLKRALEAERDALEAEDTNALQAALTVKGRYVDQLQTLDQTRLRLCADAGFSEGPLQMQQMTEWCDEESTIAERWDRLVAIAADCNVLNMTNGAIVRMRRRQIESGLAILRGVRPGSDTYGRNGTEADGLGQRSLAEA